MQLIAHRGACFEAPENSLEAISIALEQGAQGVEVDVHTTADGVPVVCHDETTARTGSHSVTISETHSDDLRRVTLANGEPIPTLAEVCDLLVGRGVLDLELKAEALDLAAVYSVLRDTRILGQTFITSFHASLLAGARGVGFHGRTGLILGSRSREVGQRLFEAWPVPTMRRVDATDLVIHHQLAHRILRRYLRRVGLGLFLWASLDDESHGQRQCRALYRKAAALEADGLVVGRVALAASVLR